MHLEWLGVMIAAIPSTLHKDNWPVSSMTEQSRNLVPNYHNAQHTLQPKLATASEYESRIFTIWICSALHASLPLVSWRQWNSSMAFTQAAACTNTLLLEFWKLRRGFISCTILTVRVRENWLKICLSHPCKYIIFMVNLTKKNPFLWVRCIIIT